MLQLIHARRMVVVCRCPEINSNYYSKLHTTMHSLSSGMVRTNIMIFRKGVWPVKNYQKRAWSCITGLFFFFSFISFSSKKGFYVKSYGVGSVVKLPGATADEPVVYPFGTTYESMYQDLYNRDPHLYHYVV